MLLLSLRKSPGFPIEEKQRFDWCLGQFERLCDDQMKNILSEFKIDIPQGEPELTEEQKKKKLAQQRQASLMQEFANRQQSYFFFFSFLFFFIKQALLTFFSSSTKERQNFSINENSRSTITNFGIKNKNGIWCLATKKL